MSDDLLDVAHAVALTKPLTGPEPRKSSNDSSCTSPLLIPSHEISFLDSVIPEEGLVEDEDYYDENLQSCKPASSSGPGEKSPKTMDIEWFSNEEEAKRRTYEIMRGRTRGSAHWLHSVALASSDGVPSEDEKEVDSENAQTAVKATGTNRIFEKLSNIAGLNNASSQDEKMIRDIRASSVPNQRTPLKKARAASKELHEEKDPLLTKEIMEMTVPFNKQRSRSVSIAQIKDPEIDGTDTATKHMSGGHISKTGSSMWDSFQRRKTRAWNYFGHAEGGI
jgi:hypothetical protein